jgi:RHS repeat-associated protein
MVTSVGTTYRLVTDQVGTVHLVVDTSSGAVIDRLDWDEFGNVLSDSTPNTQPFGFAGGLGDRDAGLTRFGARDYDPVTGRWTERDATGLEGGPNVYQYAANRPIDHVDSSGDDWRDWDPTNLNNGIQGFADDFTFGATGVIRDAFGLNGTIDKCSTAYKAGGYASLGLGLDRLAYAGGAKALPYLVRSEGAKDLAYALRVSAARNTLKKVFRLGLFPNYKAWSAAEILARYGTDVEEILAGAGRTSRPWNALGAAGAGFGAYMVGTASSGCGCDR